MKKFFVAITTAWNDELLQCHKTVMEKYMTGGETK